MRILILAILLTGCAAKPTQYDLQQNQVINAIIEGHNKLVAKVYPTPEVKK